MKRLLILCLLAAILCGCAAGNSGNTTPGSTSAPKELIPEPTITAEDLVGKTLEEVSDVLKWDRDLRAYGHGFATDNAGNPVYYTWDLNENDEFVITGAEIFAAKDTDNSPESFAQLQVGMTITEVVAKVGLPFDIPATGFFYITFVDSDGVGHAFVWDGDPLAISWIPVPEQE